MRIAFAPGITAESNVVSQVGDLLSKVPTLEQTNDNTIVVFQDGKSGSYYVRCCIEASVAASLLDLDARLIPESPDSFRANRELLLDHVTFKG